MRCGLRSLFGSFAGGGGAAGGTEPIIPPITPPGAPPGTPPGTPPTTPELVGGGSSSSRMFAISLGICFGAISFPASNWRGITLTIFGGAGAGGGGGGGGGGGATRKLVSCARGNVSVKISGIRIPTQTIKHWPPHDRPTLHGFCVFAGPSTKGCSNILHLSHRVPAH